MIYHTTQHWGWPYSSHEKPEFATGSSVCSSHPSFLVVPAALLPSTPSGEIEFRKKKERNMEFRNI